MKKVLINKLAMAIMQVTRMSEMVENFDEAKKNELVSTMNGFKLAYNTELKEFKNNMEEINDLAKVFCEIH